jgi:hypothetical protein
MFILRQPQPKGLRSANASEPAARR